MADWRGKLFVPRRVRSPIAGEMRPAPGQVQRHNPDVPTAAVRDAAPPAELDAGVPCMHSLTQGTSRIVGDALLELEQSEQVRITGAETKASGFVGC